MAINVRLYGFLRTVAGRDEVQLEADSVRAVVERLATMFGPLFRQALTEEGGRVMPYCLVYVNKVGHRLQGALEIALKDGDLVHLVPAVDGG